jgi:DMSO/TMAO reductase YedYZ molybdopterin-dependent catalytic subunit
MDVHKSDIEEKKIVFSPNRRKLLRLSPLILLAGCDISPSGKTESLLNSFHGYDTDQPDIDIENWTLTVEGLVRKPGEYSLKQISSLPKHVKNLRHCCVEGWSMIPKWGGTLMKDFLQSVGADMNAKYVAVECGDDYFTSFDMPSILHPQTLLAYEAYKKPLALEHGAPLRIVMPTKLGYKSAKWISKLVVTNEKPGGYWEDQGYDWFAGL